MGVWRIVRGQVHNCSKTGRGLFPDVRWLLQRGRLMEAIAALETVQEEEHEGTDWATLSKPLYTIQPALSHQMRFVLKPCKTRKKLIQFLGSLWEPFTEVRT